MMNIAAPPRMTVPEYFEWVMRQPRGRFELVDGRVFQMSPETNRHVLVKTRVGRVLEDAIERAKVPCVAFGDGVTVVINERTAREPDAVIQCGGEVDLDSVTIDDPMIVVEVLSPTSLRGDTSVKFAEYFSLPAVRHYDIVDPWKRLAIHHLRAEGDVEIRTRIVSAGLLEFTPPGFSVAVESFFVSLPAETGNLEEGGEKS